MHETNQTVNVTDKARSAREYFWFALIVVCLLIYLAAHTPDAGIAG